MQKATEKIKTNLLNVWKFVLLTTKFSAKKLFFKLIIKHGEKAKNTPDKKEKVFFNTIEISFFWSNLWFK